jgi:hypothetical protein
LHQVGGRFGLEQADDDLTDDPAPTGPSWKPTVFLPMSEFGTSADSLSM